ncbi:MAG: hypothetical protein LBG68_04570 [Coriobacteriales bacterium]|jgi:hypothetical protein|nr:hypothetical protein [Coriobacteriales bacterium]
MAEPAYTYRSNLAPAPAPDEIQVRRLRLLPQTENQPDSQSVTRPKSVLVSIVLAVVILATVPFIYIGLANDTMRMLVTSSHLQSDIATLRSVGHRLESQYSAMTNPQLIQRQAEELNMVIDPDPEYLEIDLSESGDANHPGGS